MFNLILNENMKIYRRIRTWIMLGLIVAILILVGAIVRYENKSVSPNWQDEERVHLQQLKSQNTEGWLDVERKNHEKQIAITEYRLEKDIPPLDDTVWNGVIEVGGGLFQLVIIFTVIVAADMVAAEFTWGTIKLLLIRPHSRSKILLSKYLSSFLFGVFALLVLFFFSFLILGLFVGFDGADAPYLTYDAATKTVSENNMVLYALGQYALNSVSLIMIVTFAFMLSAVFRSSSLAIGISLFLLFVGNTITFLLSRYEWMKYSLFANMDLNQHISGMPLIEGMTMTFSVTVLLVYFIIFNAVSWLIFNKRDVAA